MKSELIAYTGTETTLLDSLADGQWHPAFKLWKSISEQQKKDAARTKYNREDMISDLERLNSLGVLLKGDNESYRFVTEEMERWRIMSPTLDLTNPRNKPRYFGGILEDDGWVHAPLKTCHLVHFKASGDISRQDIAQYIGFPKDAVSVNEEGLFKIYTSEKETVYDLVKKLKEERPEAGISGIRLEANLKRRDVSELPPHFYSDLCKHYGDFAKVLLRSQMSSITKHLPDPDDSQQQIFIWVIEAVKRYDDSTSIPFAAYLGTNIRNWVYDLNRKANGRSIADTELKHSRAMNAFRLENEKDPSTEELAVIMNMTVEAVQEERSNINTVVNLRNQKTIDHEDFTVPLPASTTTDGMLEELIESSILSAAITTASKEPNGKRNIAGLVGIYYQTWGSDTEDKRVRSWLRGKTVVVAVERLAVRAARIVRATRRDEN